MNAPQPESSKTARPLQPADSEARRDRTAPHNPPPGSDCFDAAPVMLQCIDAGGRLVRVNHRWIATTGHDAAAVVGQPASGVLTPAAAQQLDRELLPRCWQCGAAGPTVLEFVTADGRTLPLRVEAQRRAGADGAPQILLAAHDFFEQDAVERNSERHSLRFRQFIEQMDVAIHIHRGTETLYMNPAGERLTGYTLTELQDIGLRDLIYDQDRTRIEEWLTDFAGGRHIETRQEFRIVRKDRAVRWVSLGATQITYDERPAVMVVGYDVTTRRLAERDRERLEAAVHHAGECIIFTDPDGYIRYVNPAFERLTGYSRHEALGAHNRLLMNAEFDQPIFAERWDALSAGRTWRGRLEKRRRDGTMWICQETMSPVRDSTGRVQGYVSIQRDVTTETQVVEQLQQVQRLDAVGRLCSNIAHEFGNAISAVTDSIHLARAALPSAHPVDRHLRNAADAGRMAGDLTRNLLQFSGKQPVRMTPMPLRRSVGRAITVLKSLLPATIKLQRDFQDVPPVWVTVDPMQMQQVLLNLVLNARDAMPAGGTVTLGVARRGHGGSNGRAVLRISDTGPGIPKDVRSRLFEPFFTTKGEQGGSGLGLSIVHGIVEAHDGQIGVETAGGHGVTFEIELPALSVDKLRARRRARRRPPHVLVGVPDRHVRMLLSTALDQDGLRATEVESIDEVRQKLIAQPGEFAAVLLDLDNVPADMAQVAATLHEGRALPPMVVIRSRGTAPPAAAHVFKRPFAVAELAQSVGELCRAARRRPEDGG